MSPKKDPPRSAKKSLTRLVLESNAVKSQKKLELITETVVEETGVEKILPKSVIECTPMKSSKPANLMDVTISPIASKSILQSSSESVFSESKVDNNDFGLKSLPAFTMNETKFDKSILNSYESSTGETYNTGDQTKEDSLVKDLKSVPAFTMGESIFGQSILHSYQSSIGESSIETEDREKADKTDKDVKVNTPAITPNITGTDKSVLDNSIDESKAILSSLLTSDSDIEMKEDNEAVIQKEKEKIVEIEREIHEIEKDISDEEHNVSNDSGGDEPMMEASEESEEEDDEEDSEEEEENADEEEETDEEEVEEESVSKNASEEEVS